MRQWLVDLIQVDEGASAYLNKKTFLGFGKTYYSRLEGRVQSRDGSREVSWFDQIIGSVDGYSYTREQAIRRAINQYDRRPAWQRFFIRLFTNIEWYRAFICAHDLRSEILHSYRCATRCPQVGLGRAYRFVVGVPPEWDLDLQVREAEDVINARLREEYNPQAHKNDLVKLSRGYYIRQLFTTQKIMSAPANSSWQANGLNDWNILEQLKKVSRFSSFKKTAMKLVALLEDPAIRQEMINFQGEFKMPSATGNSNALEIHANPDQASDDEACLKMLGLWEQENVTGPVLEAAFRKTIRQLHPDRLVRQRALAEESATRDPSALTDAQAQEKTQILTLFMERARARLQQVPVLETSRKMSEQQKINAETAQKLAEIKIIIAELQKDQAERTKQEARESAVGSSVSARSDPSLFSKVAQGVPGSDLSSESSDESLRAVSPSMGCAV